MTCTAINSGILDNFQTSDNLGTKICNSNFYLPSTKKQQTNEIFQIIVICSVPEEETLTEWELQKPSPIKMFQERKR